MRYVNWNNVVMRCHLLAERSEDLASWARREGPRECARLMEEARIEDKCGRSRWRVGPGSSIQAYCDRDLVDAAIEADDSTQLIVVSYAPDAARVFESVSKRVIDDLRLVRDWHRGVAWDAFTGLTVAGFDAQPDDVRALAMAARRALRRLPHMSFAEAKAASDAWHREEAERRHAADVRLLDELQPRGCVIPLAPAVGEGERHPVESLPGHYWCRLETREAYAQESARMDHCVGWESQDYAERYLGKAMPIGIWSLRHGDESILTAEVVVVPPANPNDPWIVFIVQVRAAHNRPLPSKYEVAVLWLEGLRVAPEGMGRVA